MTPTCTSILTRFDCKNWSLLCKSLATFVIWLIWQLDVRCHSRSTKVRGLSPPTLESWGGATENVSNSKVRLIARVYSMYLAQSTKIKARIEQYVTPYFWPNFLYRVKVYWDEPPLWSELHATNRAHSWSLRSKASSAMHIWSVLYFTEGYYKVALQRQM